ncbi:3364_t:CDS:2, partial [Gigaspora margarita]
RIFVINEPPSTINEYKTVAYGVPSSFENIDNSDINKEIDSDISESESAKVQSDKRRQYKKKSASSKLWNNEYGCKEIDIQVEYNSWDPYLERVVYILKDYKFGKLFVVLKWINGQETVHWADDAYSRCSQKVIEKEKLRYDKCSRRCKSSNIIKSS